MSRDYVGEALGEVLPFVGKDEDESSFLSFRPFTMDPKRGLYILVETKRRKDLIWLSAPFEIIGRVRDPQSQSWARLLRWQDDDRVVHQHPVADHDLHGEAGALCARLASDGLMIATGPSRLHFVSYLNQASVKTRVTIVPRTGWHMVNEKKVFALPGEGVGIEGRVILGANVAATHYGQAGTLEEWQASVAKLAQTHSRARFAIACAFVSPLLMITDSDGGGVNLRGPSTIGKTTLLCAAASVWGRGDERGFIRTWRGTGNGIEAAATQFSDTFLPLDEIGVASGRDVGNVTYSIAGGIGKQRANRDGSAKVPNTWRIFILSTGEISIIDKIREGGERARAGQEIRILDLEADAGRGYGVFDTGPIPEQLARELKQAAVTHYGTAGVAFVRKIIALDDVTAIAQESRDAFREQVAGDVQSGQVLRAANRLGLVAVAGELAIQVGILPWPTGSVNEATAEAFRSWHAGRGGNDPAEIRAAIEQIGGILEQHGDSRFDHIDRSQETRPVANRLGHFRDAGDSKQWLIQSNTWREVFCAGLDAKMVTRALVERGMLLPGDDDHPSQSVRIDGKVVRAYVLPVKAWRLS